jgi:hypothetical protein
MAPKGLYLAHPILSRYVWRGVDEPRGTSSIYALVRRLRERLGGDPESVIETSFNNKGWRLVEGRPRIVELEPVSFRDHKVATRKATLARRARERGW